MAFLLVSSVAFSLDYDGPELPEGWYPIHGTELTELETTLTEQATTLDELESAIEADPPETR